MSATLYSSVSVINQRKHQLTVSAYDVFGFKKGQEGTQAIVGLTAGLLSTLKLWDKHYTSLSKVPDM